MDFQRGRASLTKQTKKKEMKMNRLSEYFFEQEIDEMASALLISRSVIREEFLIQIRDEAFDLSKAKIVKYLDPIKRRITGTFKIIQEKEMAHRQLEQLEKLLAWMTSDFEILDVIGRTKREVERHAERWAVFVDTILLTLRSEVIATKAKDFQISAIYGQISACFDSYSKQKDGLKNILLAIEERKNAN